jgi:Tol biopolymer transport system component
VWVEPGLDPNVQSINLLDAETGAISRLISEHNIWEVKWDPRGGGIYYGGNDSIRRVDLATRESSIVYQSPANAPIAGDSTNFDISPDGMSIAFIAQLVSGRSVRILRLGERQAIERYTFKHECRAVAFSRDGQRLLVSGSDEETSRPSLFVIDVAGGEPRPLHVKTEYVVDFSLRHDDRELLLATGNPRPDWWMLRGVAGR